MRELCWEVCDNFLEHKDHYLPCEEDLIHEQQNIEKMRALGYWQNMLGDLLPLADANLFKCSLYIYTNYNIQKPVRTTRHC